MNYFILAKIGNVNMKKTFQKTLIAAAAGVALMSAAGTASANSLLFPYFTTASGAASILSLTNTSTSTEALHYVYNYGATCIHYDASGSMTANDILSHSIANTPLGPVGKIVAADTSTPVYFPLANTGFLIVSTKTTNTTVGLQGSMAIIDTNTGLVASYPGISNGLNTLVAANEGNFAAITDVNFALAFMPSSMVTTTWYGVVAGDQSTAIAGGANWTGVATFTNNGQIYNNDEVAYSGTTTKAITCAGGVAPTELMTAAQAAAVGANGGLIKATAAMSAGGTGVVMTKLQQTAASLGSVYGGKQFLHREPAGSF
jgi:hypothetical protein